MFLTNRMRHKHILDPRVRQEVEENRRRFARGDATISLERMLVSHPAARVQEYSVETAEELPKYLVMENED